MTGSVGLTKHLFSNFPLFKTKGTSQKDQIVFGSGPRAPPILAEACGQKSYFVLRLPITLFVVAKVAKNYQKKTKDIFNQTIVYYLNKLSR